MPDYSEHVTLEEFFSAVSIIDGSPGEHDILALDSTLQNINILLDEMSEKRILYSDFSTKDIIVNDPFCPTDEKYIKFLYSDRICFNSDMDVHLLNMKSLKTSIEDNIISKIESDVSRYKHLLTKKRYLKDQDTSDSMRESCCRLEKGIVDREYVNVFNSLRNVGCLKL